LHLFPRGHFEIHNQVKMSRKGLTLASVLGTGFSVTFKPMHMFSQNGASNIHVQEHILSH